MIKEELVACVNINQVHNYWKADMNKKKNLHQIFWGCYDGELWDSLQENRLKQIIETKLLKYLKKEATLTWVEMYVPESWR